MQPVECFVSLFSDKACQSGIASALRNFHHIFVEFFYGVAGLKTFSLLHLGVDAKHEACGVNRVAGGRTHFFKNHGFETVLSGADCGNDTADTQTADDEVISLLRSGCLFGRIGGQGGGSKTCGHGGK